MTTNYKIYYTVLGGSLRHQLVNSQKEVEIFKNTVETTNKRFGYNAVQIKSITINSRN